MAEQTQAQNSPFTIQSPTLNITEASREGLINVIFKLDPRILDWTFNTFGDSHIENHGTDENPKLVGVANSTIYECPVCHSKKDKDTSVMSQMYTTCSGTKESPHAIQTTVPVDWYPILKNAGLRYILGQINSAINTNIATGNLSGTTADMKNKMTFEERLRYLSWYQSYTMLCVIVGYPSLYISDWVINKKQLNSIFSMGFCTNFILTMSNNIMSSMTKGKGMATIGKVLETKVSTEAQTQHEIHYAYPESAALSQKKNMGDKLASLLDFSR